MKGLQIPAGGMKVLIEEAREAFSYEILQKGYELFRNGDVISLQVAPNRSELTAHCRGDATTYKVLLDLDFFSISRCACKADRYCVHMAAVFFQAYELSGQRPESFLAERTEESKIEEAQASSRARKENERKASTQQKARTQTIQPPKPDDAPEQWHAYFELKYGGKLKNSSAGMSVDGFYNEATRQLFPLSASWEPELRNLYRLHVILYALRKVDQYSRGFNSTVMSAGNYFNYMPYYINNAVKEVFSQAFENLLSLLSAIDASQARAKHYKALSGLKDFLGEHAFPAQASVLDWSGLYRLVWGHILTFPDWVQEERKRLEQLLANKKSSPPLLNLTHLALTLFDFIDKQDRACINHLLACQPLDPEDYDDYLDQLVSRKAWDRLLFWLQSLDSSIRRAHSEMRDYIYSYWQAGASAQPNNPQWREWIVSMLPQSRQIYTEYLLQSGQVRELVHSLLAQGNGMWHLDSRLLKRIEQEDIRLVLPLYHQEAERCIMQKNREAYKDAVRQLKKLASLYKKLRELDRWTFYLEHLTTRYSRLRAFQEELRKGKLIV
ncbi:MAG: hypothetical protein K0R57_2103 [Paenibacillaceae bacterium]|jgi:hypothetical protein|nr:hypothetical protein [Paenibacillaceae bacterium]